MSGESGVERVAEYPVVRLAAVSEVIVHTLADPTRPRPGLLVSYAYLARFNNCRRRQTLYFRDWVMDSGAFTVHNSGGTINLTAYIMLCRKLLRSDPKLTEVFSLDVIGDWRGSEANTKAMWKAGVPAIPTFHYGEPLDVLRGLARDYPKIAIGGAVGVNMREKERWVGQCFSAVWPAKIHGLAMVAESLVMGFPFHTVDASSWERAPRSFATWPSFGGETLYGVRSTDLFGEVKLHLDLEARARMRWAKEMEEIGSVKQTMSPAAQWRN